MLLLLDFLFGHLQVHLRVRVAGAEAEAALVGFGGITVFTLLEQRVAEVVQHAGIVARCRCPLELLSGFGVLALLVERVAVVVRRVGAAGVFLGGIAVVFFGFLVTLLVVIAVAAQQ